MRIGMGEGGTHHGGAPSFRWPATPAGRGLVVPGAWWRGWHGTYVSPVEVVEVKRDNRAMYFVGGAIVLAALIFTGRKEQ